MTKHKLSLPNVKDAETNRALAMVNAWANIVEDKIEVQAMDTSDIYYLAVDKSADPPELVLYAKDGNEETEVGRLAFVV